MSGKLANGHNLPICEVRPDKFLIFLPSQSLDEHEILRWDGVLETGWTDDDLKVCIDLLNIERSLDLFWEDVSQICLL